MKIALIQVGGTVDSYLKTGVDEYLKRLKHYTSFEIIELKDQKNASKLSRDQLKIKEAKDILAKVNNGDFVVVLDERGKQQTSEDFAQFIQDKMNQSCKRLVFIIGGAFGFADEIYQRANQKLGLSKMTFSHRMIRLLFVEQLYRAHTILKNEPYHH
ncbi:MAG: 23S rRNA (pseudouridine(1915)-N(3))-methyltransferase RlmH [Lentisphaerales bacterium]|nr:23S rRNA (pseudouridine(1915)-N(3))-methyltransferase RlmH [Lentisphaerales bacterium]